MLRRFLLVCFLSQVSIISANALPNQETKQKPSKSVIYFQPNVTQLFSELYQAYGLLNPPIRTFFENSLYLDQSIPPTKYPLQPSNQAIFDHASQVLMNYHKRVNDLELYIDPSKPKPFFYTAAGSQQLIVALIYAMVMSEPNKKFVFVEQAPFYSGHSNAVSDIFQYPNARFVSFHDPSEIYIEPDEILVEFVTSPNNPDGEFRKPVTNAEILIADLVFASSAFGIDGTGYLEKNIEWIRSARKQGKHIFSFNSASKQFGKPGSRCGYIWYPMYDLYAESIFSKFFSFISSTTIAGGSGGLADFLNLIKAFLDLPDAGKALRLDANKTLIKRHKLVEKELLNRYPGSTVISIPGSSTFFAKINDPRIPNIKASDVLFEDFAVVVNYGASMGETNEFFRLNLSGFSNDLVEFLNRLAGKNKYKNADVFFARARKSPHSTIVSNKSPKTMYIAKPNDSIIDVDAHNGAVEIGFPLFIDFNLNKIITVKKIDSSDYPVIVKTDNFEVSLKKTGENISIKWSQPFYLNGRWQIIDNQNSSEKKQAANLEKPR